MDYVYGELCQKVVKNTYTGGKTSTADVSVDNTNGIIYVVAHADSSYVDEEIANALSRLTVEDREGLKEFVTVVKQTNGKIAVTRRSITQEDIPSIEMSKIYRQDVGGKTSLPVIINSKQDTLAFENSDVYPYNKDTNKVVTNRVLEHAIADVVGATHFRGTSIDLVEEGSLITTLRMSDGSILHATEGDIVNYPDLRTKWYFNGTSWTMYENYSKAVLHTPGGDITNADVKEDAEIAQSKIAGLPQLKETVQNQGTKIDVLNGDEDTVGSVLYKIFTVIGSLDVAETSFENGDVLASIQEIDGKVQVTKKKLVKEDIPMIEQSQVNGLTTSLSNILNTIASMDMDEVEAEAGKMIFKIKEVDGKVYVETRAITANDIPTISYEKISGLAQVASSGRYSDLLNKPTLTYDAVRHCLWINSASADSLWSE